MCDYEPQRCYEVAHKARILGTFATPALKALSAREAHAGYVESLIACENATAALEARDVAITAYGSVLNRLDYALHVMARIHRTQHDRESAHSLATRMGLHRALVGRYRTYARHYTSTAVARRTQALLWANDQIRSGRYAGVLEMVAVQW
jgi:predicted solute-binding protein